MMNPSREYVSPAEVNGISQTMFEGHYADALRGWDGIMARDLNPGRYRVARGLTLLLLGELDAALTDFLEVRKPMGMVKRSVPLVGAALWLQGRREAACEDWASEIARRRSGDLTYGDSAGGAHAPALLWWASAHPGLDRWRPLAVDELRRRARAKTCRRSRWPGPLVPFLLGKSSAEGLLAAVPDPHPFRARWRCQAHFYLAAARLSAGDPAEYREHLARALSEGADAISEPEYHLARAEVGGC
jgi:hypothetical protein